MMQFMLNTNSGEIEEITSNGETENANAQASVPESANANAEAENRNESTGSSLVSNSSGAAAAAAPAGWLTMLTSVAPFAIIIVALYFIMIRPQRKRDKEITKMREQLEVGDVVTTSGGIIGIVTGIKEDSVVVETGSDRSKIRVKKWAIQTNETIKDGD
ncbi:MAG: preprotein translocase subunit YajC [Oscillospiraceae bacterium]|nr:preprotein translocase subunit YajC [Oscillospiraceae bacterium]